MDTVTDISQLEPGYIQHRMSPTMIRIDANRVINAAYIVVADLIFSGTVNEAVRFELRNIAVMFARGEYARPAWEQLRQ